jgi:5-methylcytosine-specific restriction protein A
MPWSTSDRLSRLPHDWATRRIRVLRRDAYQCQHRDTERGPKCLAPANQCDHIIPGDDHGYDNLQALCATHHARKSSAEGNAARPKRAREPEPHPGLIGGA